MRYEEAIACYDRAIDLNPRIAVTYFNKGFSLQNMAKYDEAIACFNMAIKLTPIYAKAFNRKALCLFELGQYDEAIENFSRAIQLKPSDKTFQNDREKAIKKIKNVLTVV